MAQSSRVAGSVESLWRYPVKSMAGEELHSSDVTGRGLVGDRAFALVDEEDGKVATAKNPRRWPQLFEFGAAWRRGGLPKDSGILRTVAQHNQLNAGVYASVVRGGQVRRGDAVTVG